MIFKFRLTTCTVFASLASHPLSITKVSLDQWSPSANDELVKKMLEMFIDFFCMMKPNVATMAPEYRPHSASWWITKDRILQAVCSHSDQVEGRFLAMGCATCNLLPRGETLACRFTCLFRMLLLPNAFAQIGHTNGRRP